MSFKNDLKQLVLAPQSAVNKLIAVNVMLFVVLGLIRLADYLSGRTNLLESIVSWLAVPSGMGRLASRPWTVITYMFIHLEFMHLLFNMLWLYGMGQIFESFLGYKKLIFLYFAGGIGGAAFFIILSNLVPAFRTFYPTIGASASVMALLAGTATLLPEYEISLLFIGSIKLRWLVIGYIVLDIILIPQGNVGGQLAHVGGAAIGFLYVLQLNNGMDWAKPFIQFFESFGRRKLKVAYRHPASVSKADPRTDEQTVNFLLDKISKNGYTSLTDKEKQLLFKASQERE